MLASNAYETRTVTSGFTQNSLRNINQQRLAFPNSNTP